MRIVSAGSRPENEHGPDFFTIKAGLVGDDNRDGARGGVNGDGGVALSREGLDRDRAACESIGAGGRSSGYHQSKDNPPRNDDCCRNKRRSRTGADGDGGGLAVGGGGDDHRVGGDRSGDNRLT